MVECVYREAGETDIPLIVKMNIQLIVDENHSNPICVNDLEIRMGKWLKADYRAFVVELNNHIQGYCLFRDDGDYIYIRQLFIAKESRSKGFGKSFVYWLQSHIWPKKRTRMEVLVANPNGMAFWRKIGFVDYCLTMEMKIRS